MELIKEMDEKLTFNKKEVRLVGTYEEPWFVAKDICEILELGNVTKAMLKIPNEWKGTIFKFKNEFKYFKYNFL